MAYIHFDSSYAPCGFLIVKDDGDPYNDADTVLIQTDWDFPGVASYLGYTPCDCGATDGTVDCEHKTVSYMISAAYDFLRDHEGEKSNLLDEYFGNDAQ